MGLEGSPKKYATDVSTGLLSVNRATLKRFTEPEVHKLEDGLNQVLKELRTHAVESGDIQGLKDKGLKMGRVTNALRAIQFHYKEIKNLPRR